MTHALTRLEAVSEYGGGKLLEHTKAPEGTQESAFSVVSVIWGPCLPSEVLT